MSGLALFIPAETG